MYAYEIPGLRFSLSAGAAVKRHRFVSVAAGSKGVPATDATEVIGVSMNEVDEDQVLEIADGIVIVESAGAIAEGVLVYADADGRATATEGTARHAGVAITAAKAAGEFISVKMM